ncbi:MAG: LON peptidase substrate-binding domain-containing protein [Nitrospiraceae bacterium]
MTWALVSLTSFEPFGYRAPMHLEPQQDGPNQEAHIPRDAVRIPEIVPIFALPGVVFFPRTYLPLHIFEPRYRAMVIDAAQEGQCIGMVLLKEGWETDYYGTPPIYTRGCVGRMLHVERLSDGRSNILLQGLERFDVQEQFTDRPYRRGRIALKPLTGDSTLEPRLRARLLAQVQRYIATRDNSHVWQEFLGQAVSDESLIQTISSHFDCTPLERQFLLEAETLAQQAGRVIDLIQFHLHESSGSTSTKGWG